jgi:hypothetical protein
MPGYPHGSSLTRLVTRLLILFGPLVAIGCEPPSPDGTLSDETSPLYEGAGATSWVSNSYNVPVCWDMTQYSRFGLGDVNSPQFQTWRQQIRDSAISGWASPTRVRLSGWGTCPTSGTSSFIRAQLVLSTNPAGAASASYGHELLPGGGKFLRRADRPGHSRCS